MRSVITINESLCKDVSPSEIYMALAIVRSKGQLNSLIKSMMANGYVIKTEAGYSCTNKILLPIQQLILDSQTTIDESYIEEIYCEMRELFPKGQKCTGIYWRGNKKDCITKLKKFFLKYGNYTKEEILNATKRYIASFQSDTYMQCLNYFIMKDNVSTLASVLENEENTEIVEYNNIISYDGDTNF